MFEAPLPKMDKTHTPQTETVEGGFRSKSKPVASIKLHLFLLQKEKGKQPSGEGIRLGRKEGVLPGGSTGAIDRSLYSRRSYGRKYHNAKVVDTHIGGFEFSINCIIYIGKKLVFMSWMTIILLIGRVLLYLGLG